MRIKTSHLKTAFDICGALIEAGGSDSMHPPQDIIDWSTTKKRGVASNGSWVLVKTSTRTILYHFHQPIVLA
jgi:hypothetical protein